MVRFVKVASGVVGRRLAVVSSRSVPNRLRELRAIKQAAATNPQEWSQVKVARMIGVAEDTYRRWESGRRNPSLPYRIRLAELFGVERSELGFDG